MELESKESAADWPPVRVGETSAGAIVATASRVNWHALLFRYCSLAHPVETGSHLWSPSPRSPAGRFLSMMLLLESALTLAFIARGISGRGVGRHGGRHRRCFALFGLSGLGCLITRCGGTPVRTGQSACRPASPQRSARRARRWFRGDDAIVLGRTAPRGTTGR